MASTESGDSSTKDAPAEHPTNLPPASPSSPPNGGFAAWSGVLAGFLLFLTTWGFSTAYGAFQHYYKSELLVENSDSRLSWIGTVNAFFLISSGVIAGPLFDRSLLVHLMAAGCLLTTFGLMMLSLSDQYYQVLLSQGFCCGIGSVLIYIPALSLVSTSFTSRRGRGPGDLRCKYRYVGYPSRLINEQQLTAIRRRFIPHNIHPSPTTNWLSLDGAYDGFYPASMLLCSSSLASNDDSTKARLPPPTHPLGSAQRL